MKNTVKVHPTIIKTKSCLQFDFPDYLDSEAATAAIENWKTEMKHLTKDGKRITLVLNCDSMTGFDTEARRKWQAELKENKKHIEEVWVVCNNLFVLSAAKTMGLLSGYSIRVTRSLSQVE